MILLVTETFALALNKRVRALSMMVWLQWLIVAVDVSALTERVAAVTLLLLSL